MFIYVIFGYLGKIITGVVIYSYVNMHFVCIIPLITYVLYDDLLVLWPLVFSLYHLFFY